MTENLWQGARQKPCPFFMASELKAVFQNNELVSRRIPKSEANGKTERPEYKRRRDDVANTATIVGI